MVPLTEALAATQLRPRCQTQIRRIMRRRQAELAAPVLQAPAGAEEMPTRLPQRAHPMAPVTALPLQLLTAAQADQVSPPAAQAAMPHRTR